MATIMRILLHDENNFNRGEITNPFTVTVTENSIICLPLWKMSKLVCSKCKRLYKCGLCAKFLAQQSNRNLLSTRKCQRPNSPSELVAAALRGHLLAYADLFTGWRMMLVRFFYSQPVLAQVISCAPVMKALLMGSFNQLHRLHLGNLEST